MDDKRNIELGDFDDFDSFDDFNDDKEEKENATDLGDVLDTLDETDNTDSEEEVFEVADDDTYEVADDEVDTESVTDVLEEETQTEPEASEQEEETYTDWLADDEVDMNVTKEDMHQAYQQDTQHDIEHSLNSAYEFFDKDGNPINARKAGEIRVDYVEISKILVPSRNRPEPRNLASLEESVRDFSLVVPIHVVPFGDDEYILLDGARRLNAALNLGESQIIAIVDDTINPHAVRTFESLINNTQPYTTAEKFKAGRFIESRQQGFSYDTIESIVGFKKGDYLKMLFIVNMADSFPDIYEKVMLDKMTPEQGEKKIHKELDKAEEDDAQEDLTHTSDGDEEKDVSEQRKSESPYGQQNKENRSILDASLKTAVLTRDYGVCQSCGEGRDEPEIAQLMKIHHIIPVELYGPDRRENLITLCASCHDLVHYYDEGRYLPDGEIADPRKNVVILGNMIQELRDQAQTNDNIPIDGMAFFNDSAYNHYLESAFQSSFMADVEDNAQGNDYHEVKKVYSRRERPKLKNTEKDMKAQKS